MTLPEFLLARIAEDEAGAQTRLISRRMIGGKMVEVPLTVCSGGWAFSPARVLAECEAKRRVVDLWRGAGREASMGAEWPVKQFFDGRLSVIEAAIRALATAYANHPDYRQEWRP